MKPHNNGHPYPNERLARRLADMGQITMETFYHNVNMLKSCKAGEPEN